MSGGGGNESREFWLVEITTSYNQKYIEWTIPGSFASDSLNPHLFTMMGGGTVWTEAPESQLE